VIIVRRGDVAARTMIAPGVVPSPLSNLDMDEALKHVRKTGSFIPLKPFTLLGETSIEYKRRSNVEEMLRKGQRPAESVPAGSKQHKLLMLKPVVRFDMPQQDFVELMRYVTQGMGPLPASFPRASISEDEDDTVDGAS